MKFILLSITILFNSSCATAYLSGSICGTMDCHDLDPRRKAEKLASHCLSAPAFIAIDAAGLPFLTIVVLLGGDAWPTKKEYRKGYHKYNNLVLGDSPK